MMTPSTKTILVAGLDPSLRNWGIALGTLSLGDTPELRINHITTICPILPTGKQTRQNSFDLESAKQLYQHTTKAINGSHAVFVEVPIGSQSARAMASYGICVGVLGAIRNQTSFIEVTPTEVKMASCGIKTAKKREMIEWAVATHPEANWPTYKENGELKITEGKAEHMADAIAAIYAGIRTNTFQQMLPFIR